MCGQWLRVSVSRAAWRPCNLNSRETAWRPRHEPIDHQWLPTNNVVNGRERTTTLFVHLFLRVLEAAIGGSTQIPPGPPAIGRLGKGGLAIQRLEL